MSVQSTPRRLWSVLQGALALLLAVGWLAAAGSPARAVDAWRVSAPEPGQRLSGPTELVVTVDASSSQRVRRVELRLVRDDAVVTPVLSAEQIAGDGSNGRSRWSAPFDPLRAGAEGRALANGTHRVQARVTWTGSSGEQTTAWAGHEVVVDVDPPVTGVATTVVDEAARLVQVSWDAVPLPDLRRYALQRAPADGGFSEVASFASVDRTRALDTPPDGGTWRYRVVVVRPGADGADRISTSEEHQVQLRGPSDGPTAEPEPDPAADVDPRGGLGTSTGTVDLPPPQVVVPRVDTAPRRTQPAPDAAAEGAPAPTARPRGADAPDTPDDTFEEILPFPEGTPEDQEIVRRRVLAQPEREIEGATLSIRSRELQLEEVLPPLAGGLLLFVTAGHVLRLRKPKRR